MKARIPFSAVAKNLFGTKQVMGYGANAQIWLAIDGGEVAGNCTGWDQHSYSTPAMDRSEKDQRTVPVFDAQTS